MNKIVVALLLIVAITGVLWAEKAQEPEILTLEGKIVVQKDEAGKTTYWVKGGMVELILIDTPVLQELLKIEKLAEKTFVFEGEKVVSADGKDESFKISAYKEVISDKCSDNTDDHKGHDHSSHEGSDHSGHGH